MAGFPLVEILVLRYLCQSYDQRGPGSAIELEDQNYVMGLKLSSIKYLRPLNANEEVVKLFFSLRGHRIPPNRLISRRYNPIILAQRKRC